MKKTIQTQLSVMMFLQFFIWGAWFVTMWPYLSKLGFEGTQIGFAYSTTGWAAIISPFLVGMIADRFFSTEKVLALLHFLGAFLMFWVSTVTDSALFFWALLAYTLCYMPTLALTNSISLEQMTNPEKEFPPIRVLGTIGWIVAGLLVGFMPRSVSGLDTIEDTNIPMRIAAGASLLMAIYCLFLPHTPPKLKGQKISIGDILGFKALSLLKDRSFAVFTFCSLLICIPLAFYYQSANGFLGDIGIQNPAAKMTMGQMSEIFFMLVMPFFFIRLGVKKMLLIGMAAWVLRYILFAFGNNDPLTMPLTPDTLLSSLTRVSFLYFGILLHGICYDFFFVTGQIYVDKKAPDDIRASAQGFLASITLGWGMIIGNLINGVVTKHYSVTSIVEEGGTVVESIRYQWQNIWLIPAGMAFVVLMLFAILFKENAGQEKIIENQSQ